MQIEVGKFYRTRDGEKMGPAERHLSDIYPWEVGGDAYTSDGFFLDGESSHRDLVAEWTEATPADPASEIEWGEWVPFAKEAHRAPYQMQVIDICGPGLYRYPVPKQPVVEEITLTVWGKDYLVTVTRRDGVVDDVAKISQIGASK